MKNKAFTLVELMIVVIIIGVLVAMVVPNMIGRSEQARVSVARADIDVNIATAIKLYDADTGSLPKTLDDLVVSPGDENWKGPYLDKVPVDPWKRPYVYKAPGEHRPQSYDLSSLGKDGVEGTDNVTNWE
jgi:general secretion pathway protein G